MDENRPTDEETGAPAGMDTDAIGGVTNQVVAVWDDVLSDMEATAEEYREDGWDVVELHPGDVAVIEGRTAERRGLDVLVPDDEFPAVLERLDEGFSATESDVFRAQAGGIVILLVAARDDDLGTVLLFPAYYREAKLDTLKTFASEEGAIKTHLRPLDERRIVTITHEDPALFFPE